MPDKAIDRTLSKNKVKEFILRVDLIISDGFEWHKIVEKLSEGFDTTEKRQISGFKVHFTNNTSELSNQSSFDYVLSSKSKNLSMTFSETQNAFWITSAQYKNNSIYKDIIKSTIEEIKRIHPDTEAKRIGLRYINEYECVNDKQISRVYGTRLSSVVKGMLKAEKQSRIIGVEEYNYDDYKIRLQYGIPNKFYPSILTVMNIIFDIDAYSDVVCINDEWEAVISQLNHAAYEMFTKEINPKFIEGLK